MNIVQQDVMWVRLDHGMLTVMESYRDFRRKVVKILPRIKRITHRTWLRIIRETVKVERRMISLWGMQETIFVNRARHLTRVTIRLKLAA